MEGVACAGEPKDITWADEAKDVDQYVERQVEKAAVLAQWLAAVPLLEATLAPL